ncbi:MAG: succinate dehydrogenase assembly factor 2 [Pelagibacterales bacterium]|nr:succinate dehydrogenase assembly factor 2 [Pelagibacterales bacterium]
MFENKEELKNKIIYRASYRGTKEMDILMTNFVKSLINDLNLTELKELDFLVNLDDENLINIKNNILNDKMSLTNLIKSFQKF